MIKGEELPATEEGGEERKLTVPELCQQVEKWLSAKHYASAGLFTFKTMQHYTNDDTSTANVFLMFRLLLLGAIGTLAGIFDGGHGRDDDELLAVASGLLQYIETYCGGGHYLATKILKKPASLPFLTDKSAPGTTTVFRPCFDSELLMETYVEEVCQLVLALHALLSIATGLKRCSDKDDRNRVEVCDNIGKASCWIGCMKPSDVKTLLTACLASVEGNWAEAEKLLSKATSKRGTPSDDPAVTAVIAVLEILMGTVPDDVCSKVPPDIAQLFGRCGVIGDRQCLERLPNELPCSVGGLLELSDELFLARNYSGASVLLDRCEELLTSHRKAVVEHCGIRNYRAELLYQRGRLFHSHKKNYAGACALYDASLSYCSHHLAALYQVTRLADVPREEDETQPKDASSSPTTKPYSSFPSALEQASKVGAENLKSICLLRSILHQAPGQANTPGDVEQALACRVDPHDFEAQRLQLEVFLKLIGDGNSSPELLSRAIEMLLYIVRRSVSYVPKEDLVKILNTRSKVWGGAEVPPAESGADEMDEDLFGDQGKSVSEMSVSELVFVGLSRHTIPMRWVLVLAKLLTDAARAECCDVWRTIRYLSKAKSHPLGTTKSEVGTLVGLYVMREYEALHLRLKKIIGSSSASVDPRSREIVVMRTLNHIARGELKVARQIIERALSYADEQVTISGGQNMYHWGTYAIYIDLLVLTRVGNPFECMTKKVLDGIFKKDNKRRREDTTAAPMPPTLRSRIQTLIAWMVLQQAHFSYAQRALLLGPGGDQIASERKIKKNYKALYNEARRTALQAVESDPANWAAALVMAEACKGLKQFSNATKICSLVGEYITANGTWQEKEYVENYLLKEMACSLAAEKPAPVASRGKLLKAMNTLLEKNVGTTRFLTKLTRATKDLKLADVVFRALVQHLKLPVVEKDTDEIPVCSFVDTPITLTLGLARIGSMACMERAKNTEAIKDPDVLGALISDAHIVAAAYRHVLSELEKCSIDAPPSTLVIKGPAALQYLVHENQPVIGPLSPGSGEAETVDEAQVTQAMVDELPPVDYIQQKLEEDVEALIERLTELQPLVRHEFATACAVREERLRESTRILEDLEARGNRSQPGELDDRITY